MSSNLQNSKVISEHKKMKPKTTATTTTIKNRA